MDQLWAQLFIAFLIVTADQNRKDITFLNYLKNKGKLFVLSEYIVLLSILELPFIIFRQLNYLVIIPIIVIAGLLVLKYHFKILVVGSKLEIVKRISARLPLHSFEWRCGLRKNKYLFLISYLLGFLLLLLFPVTPAFMIYWLTFSGEFYNGLENKEIIQAYKKRDVFWSQKIPAFFISVNALFLPHYILYLILYHQQEQIIVLIFSVLVFNLVFIYAALFKYQFFAINQKRVFNSLPVVIFMFIVLIIPVSFYLLIKAWKNSNQSLQRYLN